MNTIELNAMELLVLGAIKRAHRNAGGDFTYSSEVMDELPMLSKPQVKGYLSQLSQKDYITIENDEFHQITFRKKSLEIYPDLEKTCHVF